MSDTPIVGECDCCGFEAGVVTEYRHSDPRKRDEHKHLCDLCAGTMTGTYNDYPRVHDSDKVDVMKTICYVGNVILSEMRERRAVATEAATEQSGDDRRELAP